MAKKNGDKDRGVDIHFPAPDTTSLSWSDSEKMRKNQVASDQMQADAYEWAPREYLVAHGFDIYHVKLDRDLGACTCKDFEYRSGQPTIPCKHIIKTRDILTQKISELKQPNEKLKFLIDQHINSLASIQPVDASQEKCEEIETEIIHPLKNPVITMIRGLSPLLAEIGKIKIGIKGELKQSSEGTKFLLPRKLDHFEIFTNVRDKEGRLVRDEAMMKLIGDKSTELDIHLLYNRIDLNFPTSYARYEGRKCLCRGDGQFAYESENSLTKPIRCDPETCLHRPNKKCKPNGILSVILDKSERVGGVYKFRTTSYNTIRNILTSMALIQALTGGVLSGIPLKMVLRPKTVYPAESPTPQTVYVVNIEYAGGVQKLLSEALEIAKAQSSHIENMKKLELLAQEALALPESPEETGDIQSEFYPENPEG